MDSSASSSDSYASSSFSSEIDLFREEAPEAPPPLLRILPRHFHEPRLLYLLWFSRRWQRAVLLREEVTVWEAAWGSIAINHRILLLSPQQTWLAVGLGNRELHRCVTTAVNLGP